MKKYVVGAIAGAMIMAVFAPNVANAATAASMTLGQVIRRLLSVESQMLNLKLGYDQNSSPSALAKNLMPQVEKAVFLLECGSSVGSGVGLAVSLAGTKYSGAIGTNEHVIRACKYGQTIKISQNGKTWEGVVFNWDEGNDLALVVTTTSVDTIKWSATAPNRGDFAMAFGAPFAVEGSISTGIVSNMDEDTVLTDTAVDPGNSGGPLVNYKGELLGINAWHWEGAQGSNHAIKPGVFCREILNCTSNSGISSWSW